MNVGIIGCGVIAPSHIDSYNAIDGVAVTAICDLLPERMEQLSARYPECEFVRYSNVDALLADETVSVVSVCTDHASHEELFIKALDAGKHVLCEKALTISLDWLERMLSAANASDKVTGGIFQHRFDPVYLEVKNILEEKSLGKILTISCQHQCWRSDSYYAEDAWRGTWEGEGGSLLINQSIHYLDILQWISGGVESVCAHVENIAHDGVIETEDTASVSMKLGNGALGSFTATSCSHRNWESAIQIVGTDGDLHIRNEKLEFCTHKSDVVAADLHDRLTNLEAIKGVEGAKAHYGSSHPAQINDFVQAIREGRKPFVDLQDASDAVRLVLAIYESAKTGTAIQPES